MINQYNENGEKHGTWEKTYLNSKYKCNFINGKINGEFFVYRSNGQLEYKYNCFNDKQKGKFEWYLNNGKLSKIKFYL